MAAPKHWSGFYELDTTPPSLDFMLNNAPGLNCLTEAQDMPPSPSLSVLLRQEVKWLWVFPSFFFFFYHSVFLDFLLSFSSPMCQKFHKLGVVMWGTVCQPFRSSLESNQLSGALISKWLRLIFGTPRTAGSFLEWGVRQLPGMHTGCIVGFMYLPRTTSCWHWPRGLERDRERSERVWLRVVLLVQPWEGVGITLMNVSFK